VYLAFESVYVRRLISLGYRDTMARRPEVEEFLRAPSRDHPEEHGWKTSRSGDERTGIP
jgi:NTE family protein